jgi:hypothetical protein
MPTYKHSHGRRAIKFILSGRSPVNGGLCAQMPSTGLMIIS